MIIQSKSLITNFRSELNNIPSSKKWEATRGNLHLRAKLIMRNKGLKNRQSCLKEWAAIESEISNYFNQTWDKQWFETKSIIKSFSSEKEKIISDYLGGKF